MANLAKSAGPMLTKLLVGVGVAGYGLSNSFYTGTLLLFTLQSAF